MFIMDNTNRASLGLSVNNGDAFKPRIPSEVHCILFELGSDHI